MAGQKTGKDVIIFMYDNNGDIFGFTYNGEEYYYVKNAQNDVVLIVNSDKQSVVLYQYDAWGNIYHCYDVSGNDIGTVNPITYRSYYYDVEFGIYYLNSRYYVPALHRFLNEDNLVAGIGNVSGYNLFAYCNNNPVMFSDETGHIPRMVSLAFADGGYVRAKPVVINIGTEVKEADYEYIMSVIGENYPDNVTSIYINYVGPKHAADKLEKLFQGLLKYGAETGITALLEYFGVPSVALLSAIYEVWQIIYDSLSEPDLLPGDYSVYHVSIFSEGVENNGTFKKSSKFIGLNSYDVYISDDRKNIHWKSNIPIYGPADSAYYYYMP